MLTPRAQTHSPADVVERFYGALSRHNTGAVEAMADRWFAPDITLELPSPLSSRSNLAGEEPVKRFFCAMASPTEPTGPAGFALLDLIDGGDKVAAQLAFRRRMSDRTEIAVTSVDWWTFTDRGVSWIRSFFDTGVGLRRPSHATRTQRL